MKRRKPPPSTPKTQRLDALRYAIGDLLSAHLELQIGEADRAGPLIDRAIRTVTECPALQRLAS